MKYKRRTWNSYSSFLLFNLLILFSLARCGNTPTAPPTINPLGVIGDISEERSKAEQWVKVLKADWGEDTPEYKKGRSLYINAKASFDGWIEQLKLDIVTGRTPESSEYENSLNEALEKSTAFIEYVEALETTPQLRALIRVDVVDIIVEVIVGAGIEIWKAYRDADIERKEQIIEMLDELKWKSFEEI